MTAVPVHEARTLPLPRRRGSQPYHDVTRERLFKEKAAQSNAEGGVAGMQPGHDDHPRSRPGDHTASRMEEPASGSDGGTVLGATQILPLSRRLLDYYGPGDNAGMRLALFMRLERLINQFGSVMDTIVRDCAIKAQGADDPGRYFCKAARLATAEYLAKELPL